jgi:flagellar protein FliS
MAIAMNAFETYKKQGVMTASPIELVIMLYDGGLRQIHAAKTAILGKDYAVANTALLKAQDIVTELASSLDMDFPVSNQLMQLYDFVLFKLREVNSNKEAEGLDEAADILSELREAWMKVKSTTRIPCVLEG